MGVTTISGRKRKLKRGESEPPETMYNKKIPGPCEYDNFKIMFDRSKLRNFTIGKKFQPSK